ncbi:LuxR C-terminal-related transcriptional regulator [Nocardia alni]|uniref:LuxR C-terminal-related transcriptional regulator n=1 Tax=Nocardia alni TaxID=2815723 RepID=UPI001C23AEC1|nr:LuxR C-terminal-related transcriptional regulator [Nocardia alni]
MRTSRLVTLTGPGGVGKTRLALHIANSSRGAFADGIWMVPLAELSQADLIPSTIMATMGEAGPNRTDVDDLIGFLENLELLLVLDNCEHLAEPCARIASAILERCPKVRLMMTSREALRIAGEAIFTVPPLSLPDAGERIASGSAVLFDAVALFKERATAVEPEFVLRPEDESQVVELCRRLDGLPLAIELAAASMRWLPLGELTVGAATPLALVTSPSRSSPVRQHTLRASLDYSYDLCSPGARALWARLSVFRGSAELDAIRSVWSADSGMVEPLLAELVDKSLLMLTGGRYVMLETIRQYGSELLISLGSANDARRAHVEYFAAMASDLEAFWSGQDQAKHLSWAKVNSANIRAALEYCLESAELLDTGLRIAAGLWSFWSACNFESEGGMWLTRLIDADARLPGAPRPALARGLWAMGFLEVIDGKLEHGSRSLDRAIALAREIGDPVIEANAAHSRGFAELLNGDIDSALHYLEHSVKLERDAPAPNPFLALSLLSYGLALCFSERRDEAAPVLAQARALSESSGDFLHSWSLVFLGLEALLDGRLQAASALLTDGLASNVRGPRNNQGLIWATEFLGWAAFYEGDARRAARLLGGSEALSDESGPYLVGFTILRRLHEDYVDQVRAALGPEIFEEERSEGRRLDVDALIAMALDTRRTGPAQKKVAVPAVKLDLPLTPRESEIAERIAAGLTNRAIAAELVISKRTVDTHVENILVKLGFSSRTQIVALLTSMDSASGKN